MVFYIFSFVGARAQVSSFLPNFDVTATKKAKMKHVYVACFGRGEIIFTVFRRLTIVIGQ